MDTIALVQWPCKVLVLAGAPLVACRSDARRFLGFYAWLLSNVCWIIWGIQTDAWALVAMQTVFCATSAQGAWNNRSRGVGFPAPAGASPDR